jgi:hypothetical protein
MLLRGGSAVCGVLIAVACTGSALASEIAVDRPLEICDLVAKCDARTGSVVVSWAGGAPPFSVVRSDAASFDQATKIKELSTDVRRRRYDDSGACRTGQRFYYQVYDRNSAPDVWSITSTASTESQRATVPGTKPAAPYGPGCVDECKGTPRCPATW